MRKNHARGYKLLNRLFCLLLCVSFMTPGLSVSEEIPGEPEGVVWCEHEEHAASGDELFVFESPESVAPADAPACAHESAERIAGERGNESDWRYETENHHVRTFDRTYRTVCLTCGALLEEETACESSEWAEHRFGADGACLDCKWRPAPLETPAVQPVEVEAPAPEPADTPEPAEEPTADLTGAPEATAAPATEPTAAPADDAPTAVPDGGATPAPEVTIDPTAGPEEEPTAVPTGQPEATDVPTTEPTADPTDAVPTAAPDGEATPAPEVTTALTADLEEEPAPATEEGLPEGEGLMLLSAEESAPLLLAAAQSLELSGCQPEHNRQGFMVSDNYSEWRWWAPGYHRRTYDQHSGVYCADCDLTFYTSTEQREETEMHRFDSNNMCTVCGGRTVCNHGSTNTQTFYKTWDYTYKTADETTHKAGRYLVTRLYCTSCGVTLSESIGDEPVWIGEEAHNFNSSGTCVNCGYSSACTHPNVRYDANGRTMNFQYVQADEKQHRVYRKVAPWYYCPDCRTGWYGEYAEEESDYLQDHSFSGGHCSACGYQSTCQHENTTVETYTSSWGTYVIENDYQHSRVYNNYERTTCADCGEQLSNIPVSAEKKISSHSFANGACYNCGYECKHPNLVGKTQEENKTYRQIEGDATYHLLVYDERTRSVCGVCGQEYGSMMTAEGASRQQRHTFNESGVCADCGFANTCAHQYTSQNVGYEYSSASYEQVDETWHKMVVGTATVYTYCRVCKQTIKEELVENYETLGSHSFRDDGACYYCDYYSESEVNTCKHENTVERVHTYNASPYTMIDETYHSASVERHTITFCADCGKELNYTLEVIEGASELESHYFGSDGKCRCGYFIPCTHENTTTFQTKNYFGCQYIYIDEEYHVRLYDLIEETICKDCGRTITSKILQEDILEDEMREHAFSFEELGEIGECICGYCIECEHESIERKVYDVYYAMAANEICHYYYHEWDYEFICIKCGSCSRHLMTKLEKAEYTAPHTFVNDICTECGFEVECTHKNTYRGLLKQINGRDYAQKDDKTHTTPHGKSFAPIVARALEKKSFRPAYKARKNTS